MRMKAVILAAGNGSRLRPFTLDTPKPLLEIAGRPLIHYSIDALRLAGISEIAVVVGYMADKMEEALGETHPSIAVIRNEDYRGGNALSVCAARSFAGDEPFVVCMADHLVSSDIVERLLDGHEEDPLLCVDPAASHSSQTNDATRVMVNPSGYVSAIGKALEVWNAIDTGVFMMSGDFFPAAERLIASYEDQVSLTNVVRAMGYDGSPFATCDVSGMFWADVDTREDYESVEGLLMEEYANRI